MAADRDTDAIDEADYILLVTFRQDGSPVPTPVWVHGSDGSYAVMTKVDTHKVSRLRQDSRVEVAPCDIRGNIAPGAPRFTGTARLETDPDVVARTVQAITGQYGFRGTVMRLLRRGRDLLPGDREETHLIVQITLDDRLDDG
ncbi:PPOX class F420-dependent oxidoreductase [Euzebya tangerina]|uniref:PPOX class F420-dependent oxidoreductase n=1 Tax=Euzebya tangerina TaxID=591198 RepID=UPI0013C2A2DD|nr:PPOX class F420-dependent oxidoreductase [Euzebya tangerina]